MNRTTLTRIRRCTKIRKKLCGTFRRRTLEFVTDRIIADTTFHEGRFSPTVCKVTGTCKVPPFFSLLHRANKRYSLVHFGLVVGNWHFWSGCSVLHVSKGWVRTDIGLHRHCRALFVLHCVAQRNVTNNEMPGYCAFRRCSKRESGKALFSIQRSQADAKQRAICIHGIRPGFDPVFIFILDVPVLPPQK